MLFERRTIVSRIIEINSKNIVVERLVEDGYERLKLTLPCLLTVVKEISYPRLPTLKGKQKADRSEIPIWDAEHIGIDRSQLGLKGSPTRVVKIGHPKVARGGSIIKATEEEKIEDAADEFIKFLQKRQLL